MHFDLPGGSRVTGDGHGNFNIPIAFARVCIMVDRHRRTVHADIVLINKVQ
jgi:hypothetical protein